MTIDDKITLFNSKLDAELNVMGASLRAARVAFDHMKTRTNALITKIERGHTRMVVGAVILGTIGTLVVGGLTWVGYSNVQTIVTLEQAVSQAARSITKFRQSGGPK